MGADIEFRGTLHKKVNWRTVGSSGSILKYSPNARFRYKHQTIRFAYGRILLTFNVPIGLMSKKTTIRKQNESFLFVGTGHM